MPNTNKQTNNVCVFAHSLTHSLVSLSLTLRTGGLFPVWGEHMCGGVMLACGPHAGGLVASCVQAAHSVLQDARPPVSGPHRHRRYLRAGAPLRSGRRRPGHVAVGHSASHRRRVLWVYALLVSLLQKANEIATRRIFF